MPVFSGRNPRWYYESFFNQSKEFLAKWRDHVNILAIVYGNPHLFESYADHG